LIGTSPQVGATGRERSRWIAALIVLIGAGVLLLAAGRPWASVPVTDVPGRSLVSADGQAVAPGAPAIGLVALAGAFVLVISGRWLRRLVAILMILAGLGAAALGVPVLDSPWQAVAPALAIATGSTGGHRLAATASAWPAISGLGGVLIAVGGLLALVRGGRWPVPTGRYERAAATPGLVPPQVVRAPSRDDRLDDWDRLSRGEDPTAAVDIRDLPAVGRCPVTRDARDDEVIGDDAGTDPTQG
jgi:uncharacterized membrane protein (TIGR02234 family)